MSPTYFVFLALAIMTLIAAVLVGIRAGRLDKAHRYRQAADRHSLASFLALAASVLGVVASALAAVGGA